jgi:hypothetical protein
MPFVAQMAPRISKELSSNISFLTPKIPIQELNKKVPENRCRACDIAILVGG